MGRKKGDPRRSTIAQQIVGFENSETKDVDINKCRTRVRKSVVLLFRNICIRLVRHKADQIQGMTERAHMGEQRR